MAWAKVLRPSAGEHTALLCVDLQLAMLISRDSDRRVSATAAVGTGSLNLGDDLQQLRQSACAGRVVKEVQKGLCRAGKLQKPKDVLRSRSIYHADGDLINGGCRASATCARGPQHLKKVSDGHTQFLSVTQHLKRLL